MRRTVHQPCSCRCSDRRRGGGHVVPVGLRLEQLIVEHDSRWRVAPRRTPGRRPIAASRRFLKHYVNRDGRVVRVDQGGDTVGEGQAYGMLMAAAIGDKKRFNLIWDWTQKNLVRPDGLISFLWQNRHIVDPQAASDADLDASRALLLAGCRFHQPAFKQQALRIGSAILRVEVGSASFQGAPVLTAGPWAITPPPPTINVSYFSPASFARCVPPPATRRGVHWPSSSRAITSKLMPTDGHGCRRTGRISRATTSCRSATRARAVPPQFGFDAVRTLIRMAEDPNPLGREIAARAWPVFENQVPTNIGIDYTLSRSADRTLGASGGAGGRCGRRGRGRPNGGARRPARRRGGDRSARCRRTTARPGWRSGGSC